MLFFYLLYAQTFTMKLRYIFFLLITFGLLMANHPVKGQLGLGILKKNTKIKLTPKKADYWLDGEDAEVKPGYFPERERWLVFSDRAGNNTYKSPASDVQLKSLGFMDPCYVIRRKGDYLELVSYDPKLFKNPHKRLIDIKSANYLGWVNKSRLLLWRNALREQHTGFFIKGVTCFKGEKAIKALAPFAANDSLMVFSSPSMKQMISKSGMEALFYIFKQSEDGNQFLVGRKPQFTADSRAEAVIGWIPASLVKAWGERSFFTRPNYSSLNPEKENEPGGNRSIFIHGPTLTDTLPDYQAYSCCKGVTAYPLLERIFPVQAQQQKVNGREMIKTGVLKDILDRSENEVINVLGNKISYNAFSCLLSCQHKANIVFVVDGGAENGKYMNALQTVVQHMELYFDTASLFTDYRFGAVVYKDNLSGRCSPATLPLTASYPDLEDFFYKQQQEMNNCNDNLIQQAVFSGLGRAARLLNPYKDESNIIVLIGAAGNNMRSGEDMSEIIRQLSYTNTRLLVFQTYNGSNPAYNNFFIQGKTLVERTAFNISEHKKEKLVNPDDNLKDPDFTLVQGDSGVFYLDYPKSAMTQGFVLFPEQGQTMQPTFLVKGLHSLMVQIHNDNERMERSLRQYFSVNGTRTTRIQEPFRPPYPSYGNDYLPARFLKEALSVSEQPFYVPAWVENTRFGDTSANVKFGLLASGEEYEQVVRALSMLGGDRDYSRDSRKAMYRHLCREAKHYLKAHDITPDKRISRLSMAALMECMTGYKSTNSAWTKNELRLIKKWRSTTRRDVVSFLTACREKSVWLAENTQNNAIRFENNGQVWYWLTAEHLP